MKTSLLHSFMAPPFWSMSKRALGRSVIIMINSIMFSALILCCPSVHAESLKSTILETYESLAHPPKDSVELTHGIYHSLMNGLPCPYRVFSPKNPTWSNETDPPDMPEDLKKYYGGVGMKLIVYVLNLGIQRLSSAPDREIIEGLLKKNMLVVVIDFRGEKRISHFHLQKDIFGLYCIFGGNANFKQADPFRLGFPGPNAGKELVSFLYKNDSSEVQIPIHRNHIYLIPSGYTVDIEIKYKTNIDVSQYNLSTPAGSKKSYLLMSVAYPMPSKDTQRVPLFLHSFNTDRDTFLTFNVVLPYSWLFNGYAQALIPGNYGNFPAVQHAIRYARWKKDTYSLNGKVAVAGISGGSRKPYTESNWKITQKDEVDLEPYGKGSPYVDAIMPPFAEPAMTGNILDNLDESSPALYMSYAYKDRVYRQMGRYVNEKYAKAGYEKKHLYLCSPLQGHHYDVHNWNKIMPFFDTYCQPPNTTVSNNDSKINFINKQPKTIAATLDWLRSLDFRFASYTANDIESLKVLDLSFTTCNDEGLTYLQSLPSLGSIDLTGTLITDEGMKHIGALTNLREFSLGYTEVTDKGLRELSPLISLNSLKICGYQFTDWGFEFLASFLKLKNLNLTGTRISDKSLGLIKNTTSLENLALWDTLVTGECFAEFSNLKLLTDLNVRESLLNDSGLKNCVQLTGLTNLVLGRTKVTEKGLEGLTLMPALSKLTLRMGIDYDFSILARLPSLRSLELDILFQAYPNPKPLSQLPTSTSLKYLHTLHSLNDLYIRGYTLTDEQSLKIINEPNFLSELKKALPNCKIKQTYH